MSLAGIDWSILRFRRLAEVVVCLAVTGTITAALGQTITAGPDSFPITISVNPLGEIAVTSGGALLIDKGQIFVADHAPQVNWRRLMAAAVSEESAKGASPTRVVLTYAPADAKPIHFFLRAASGNDLAGPFSLATDAPPGVHCRFMGRIHWGQDPWLVQLGQDLWQGQPAERITSVPAAARHTHSSVASLSSPGFVSAPRNPNVFQMAAGAVSDLNSDTLYDPTSDRALVFHGPHVTLEPSEHEDQSDYWVEAEVHPGDEATRVPLSIPGRWFGERLAYRPTAFPRLLFVEVPMGRVIGTQIPFFRPMSTQMRADFPQAPSGWLPVYFTLPRVDTPEERERTLRYSANYESLVIQGAQWFGKNLRPDAYGSSAIIGFVEWGEPDKPITNRSVGSDLNGRDWRTYTRVVYPHGPRWMSDQMHRLGLKSGSWFVPQAWDTDDLYREHPDWFMHYPDGRPLHGDFWMGKYLIDISDPGARDFASSIVRKVADKWGVDYLWLDGFESNLMENFYSSASPYFHDPTLTWWEACREFVKAMRRSVGPTRYLSFDGSVMPLGMGIANGSRTAADPNQGGMNWEHGGITALTGTMDYYFLNRTGWYCDPDDAFLVGEPLTLDQARLWATMVSLTGQYVMDGDAVWELSSDRINVLKSVFPSPPVRPTELYSRHGQTPRIWDLRLAHLGRQWDVLMLANWQAEPQAIAVKLDDIGLNSEGSYLMFDFWSKKSLGIVADGRIELLVPPTGSRLIRLTPLTDHPDLFGLTRHVTQGLMDLRKLSWDAQRRALQGTSLVPGGDDYEFWVYVPPGYSFGSIQSSVGSSSCKSDSRSVLACVLTVRETSAVSWRLRF